MRIIYLDGDNRPGFDVLEGMEFLSESDFLKIYYNSKNTFFHKKEHRAKIETKAPCKVEFAEVPEGKDSVDFAIAIDASYHLGKDINIAIALISSDNHFKIARDRINVLCGESTAHVAKSIRDLLVDDVGAINRLETINKLMQYAYGADRGNMLFNKAEQLFYSSFNAELKEREKSRAASATDNTHPAKNTKPRFFDRTAKESVSVPELRLFARSSKEAPNAPGTRLFVGSAKGTTGTPGKRLFGRPTKEPTNAPTESAAVSGARIV